MKRSKIRIGSIQGLSTTVSLLALMMVGSVAQAQTAAPQEEAPATTAPSPSTATATTAMRRMTRCWFELAIPSMITACVPQSVHSTEQRGPEKSIRVTRASMATVGVATPRDGVLRHRFI